MLDNLLERMNKIEKKVSVDRIRYKEPHEEARQYLDNMFYLSLFSVVFLMGIFLDIKPFIALAFFLFLFSLLWESYLWNFALCPEKRVLKPNVYGNRVIFIALLFTMTLSAANVIDEKIYTLGLSGLFMVLIWINAVIVKKKASKITMNNDISVFEDEVTDWAKEHVGELAESISYIGICLTLASFAYGGIGISRLVIKFTLFAIGFCAVNNRLNKVSKAEYICNYKLVDILLIVGILVNVVCLYVAAHYKGQLGNNYENIRECIIGFSFFFMTPLARYYVRISTFIKKIRYVQDRNGEEI